MNHFLDKDLLISTFEVILQAEVWNLFYAAISNFLREACQDVIKISIEASQVYNYFSNNIASHNILDLQL